MKKNTIIFLKSLTIISFLFLLVSCIGIETEIEFKNSNSGTVKLKYRVSKMVINTAQIDSDSSFLPLPIEENDFIEKSDENEDLELLSYKKEDNNEEVFITAEFSFDSIDALNAVAGSTEDNVKITVDKRLTKTVYRHEIFPGSSGNIDTETMQVVSDLYSNYPVKFTIITPSEIKEVNKGVFNANKAEIQMTVPEIIASDEPVFIEISW